MGRASDEPLARWEAVTPTVHECLADLTEEVSQVIEWAGIAVDDDGHYDAAALEKAMAAWGLTPLTFLAAALKRRNPARAAAAVRAARAKKDAMARATYDAPATIFDASLGAVLSRYPPRPNSANREAEGEEAADVAGGFGEFAAAALVGRLAAGAVYSGGTQLKLLWCDGDEAVLTLPSPPPPPPPEAALAEELALARSRIDAAMPAVLGTEQPPLPRRALAAGEVRLPLDQLAGWLQGGRWEEHGLGADFARGLHTELLSRTFTDPSYARSLLRVDRGALDLSPFVRQSDSHAAAAVAAVREAESEITEVVGLGPYMLQCEPLRAELRAIDSLTTIRLAPLGTEVKAPEDIDRPYRTTDFINPAWEALSELLQISMDTTMRLNTLVLGPQRISPTEAAFLGATLCESTVQCLDISRCLHTSLEVAPDMTGGPSTYGMPRGGNAPPPPPSADDDVRMAEIASAFAPMLRCSHLLELRVSRCQLADTAMVLLCQNLRTSRSIATLDVSFNCFFSEGAAALAALIHQSGCLRHIDLSGNRLVAAADLALTPLAAAIGESMLETITWEAGWPDLAAADLPSHPKRSQWGVQLARALRLNKSLTSLSLAGQPLGALEMPTRGSDVELREERMGAELGGALRAHWGLLWISLANASLHDAALCQIVGALRQHPSVRHVDLSYNTFGRRTAEETAGLLHDSRSLTSLNVQGVSMSATQLAVIAPALAANVRLLAIDLSYNTFGAADDDATPEKEQGAAEEGADAAVEEAATAPPLAPAPAVLSAMALAAVFEKNTVLTELRLAHAGLDQPQEPAAPEAEEEGEGAEAAAGDGEVVASSKEPAEVEVAPATKSPRREPSVEDVATPPQPPAPPPLLGAILGEGLAKSVKNCFALLDLSGNALGDEGVAAFAGRLSRAKSLRSLYLLDCCGSAAEPALISAIGVQGGIVLCDLHLTPQPSAEAPLQLALASNRWEHGMLWEELLDVIPAEVGAAVSAAFRGIPGVSFPTAASEDAVSGRTLWGASVPLSELLRRLLPPSARVAVDTFPPGARLPFGGFVQWVGDFFANRWDARLGPSGELARLLRAMCGAPREHALSSDEAVAPGEWVEAAAMALCEQRRRYFYQPKVKPRVPPEAEELAAEALQTIVHFVESIKQASLPPTSPPPEPTLVNGRKINIDANSLALKGICPVSYFGSRGPHKGSYDFKCEHDGATYLLTSEEAHAMFAENPSKFTPAYNGWCAAGIAGGEYKRPDPRNYMIVNGKVLLFYKDSESNARDLWEADKKGMKKLAEANWRSGNLVGPPEVEFEVGASQQAAISQMLACDLYGDTIAELDERMHPELTPELSITDVKDVLHKVYRLELQMMLRLEEHGKAPSTILHEKPRCFFDDWDYFLQEKKAQPGDEWLCCLSWLQRGTPHVLERQELGLLGSVVKVAEALISRPFSAGTLRCALIKVNGGPWRIAGLQVKIDRSYLPPGPLLTWHDSEPFEGLEDPPTARDTAESEHQENASPR